MKNNTLKKVITAISLVCVGASVVLGVLLLLKVIPADKTVGCVYLSLLTVFLTGLFLLNAVAAATQKSRLGGICAFLLLLSAALFLVNIWLPVPEEQEGLTLLLKIAVALGAVTILFDFIVGNVITVRGHYMLLQILEYLAFGYVLFAVVCLIFDNPFFVRGTLLTVLGIVALLALGSFIALAFLKKSYRDKNPAPVPAIEQDRGAYDEFISIKKSEYLALLARIRELESQKNRF